MGRYSNFVDPHEDESRQNQGDWSHYGRHKAEEHKQTEEYMEKLRNQKTEPTEARTVHLSPTESKDVYEEIRNFKSNLPTLAEWKRRHKKNRKGKKGST